jgi:hypothetical protein
MDKNELKSICLLNSCQDEMWHMMQRMIFLTEIYNSIGFGHCESLLALVFDDIENFIPTLKKLVKQIDEYHGK